MTDYLTATQLAEKTGPVITHDEAIYTPNEIAAIAGCDRGQIDAAIKRGDLKSFLMGRRLRRIFGGHARAWLECGVSVVPKVNVRSLRKVVVPHKHDEGFVYFARCEGFVKIGFARDVKNRLISLNTSTPFKIELIGSIPGSFEMEGALHMFLRYYRHKLEWFRLEPKLEKAIRGLCNV